MRPNANAKNAAKQNARGLNENYARELMELHTLGVDGGYSQKDVTEVARCFTGWTIDKPNQGGSFTFNEKIHDQGEKTVLGVTIPAGGGQADGEQVLDILAHHPSTAKFISRELAQRFVADDPPLALTDRMAQTFHDTDGDIRAVLDYALFNSPEFFSQGAFACQGQNAFRDDRQRGESYGNQKWITRCRSPINSTPGASLLYRKLEPTGYSNVGSEWVNSAALLDRMNFGLQLGQNHVQGSQLDPKRFANAPVATARRAPCSPTRQGRRWTRSTKH